jgi:peptidoglycan hydrolase CwlO-like protein
VSSSSAPPWVRLLVVPAVFAVLLAGMAALPAAARAGAPVRNSADARREVAATLARVRTLQVKAAQLTRAYDEALTGVERSVSANIEAGRRADELDGATRHASDRTTNRVRGLYMSGGPLAVYGTLLGAGNVVDLANRTEMVERVLNSDRSREAGWRTNSHDARRTATKAARAVVTRVHTVRDIAEVYAALKQTLAEEQGLLARARQQLRRIQAQEAELARRAEAARRAAAAAAASAAAADAAAAEQERLQIQAQAAAAAQAAGAGQLEQAKAAVTAAQSTYLRQADQYRKVTTNRVGNVEIITPPPDYMQLYHAAAPTCPGLSWTVLAAIGQVETGHGMAMGTSTAGAMGPMAFEYRYWYAVSVDGNGDGVRDIMNPADAIFSAAHLLCQSGAQDGPGGLYRAIYQYNHDDYYVRLVLRIAAAYCG